MAHKTDSLITPSLICSQLDSIVGSDFDAPQCSVYPELWLRALKRLHDFVSLLDFGIHFGAQINGSAVKVWIFGNNTIKLLFSNKNGRFKSTLNILWDEMGKKRDIFPIPMTFFKIH